MNNKGRTYDNPNVTLAKIEESEEAAELIYLTAERLFQYLFYPDRQRTMAVLKQLFEMDDNDFSHQNAYIAKLDRQITGLIIFMDRITMKNNHRKMGWKIMKAIGIWAFVFRLFRFIRAERMITKISDSTLYINHIAIFNEFRRRGMATHLLGYCEKQAGARSLTRLALDVRVVNVPAIRVYEQFGFQKIQKIESKALNSKFGFGGLYRMHKEI
jgi:ribosomal protein S18 acetylase RimI-like enzyme